MGSVSILGSGNMARGIATRALAGGNSVQILDRDNAKAAALASDLPGDVVAGLVGDALRGDIVVLAVPYDAAVPLVTQYGAQLVGKTVVDITNPVDFATFDALVTPADSSASEEIAKGTSRRSARSKGVQHHLRGHPRRRPGRRSAVGRAHCR